MHRTLTFGHTRLVDLFRATRAGRAVAVAVGTHRTDTTLEVFARPASVSPARSGTDVVYVQRLSSLAIVDPLVPPGALGILLLGEGPVRGLARGYLNDGSPFDELRIVGPGLPRIGLGGDLPAPAAVPVDGPWSRTAGACGDAAWQRLTSLRVGLVGAGRLGSLLAVDLAKIGAGAFTLVDPDRVEEHDALDMDGATIGQAKVDALGGTLARLRPDLHVVRLALSVSASTAARALADCDLVFCAVDADGARLLSALYATLYCKPLLDVGSGVFGEPNGLRDQGCDVRLLLPGDDCILCFGGLAEPLTAARTLLSTAEAEGTVRHAQHWRDDRAGSLASLNRIAAGLAVTAVLDLLQGRLRTSVWHHVRSAADGTIQLRSQLPVPRSGPPCVVCALSGSGDDGLRRLPDTCAALAHALTPRPPPYAPPK